MPSEFYIDGFGEFDEFMRRAVKIASVYHVLTTTYAAVIKYTTFSVFLYNFTSAKEVVILRLCA